MVRRDVAPPGTLLITPRPVQLHDREYGLADDLPPATLYVFLAHVARGGLMNRRSRVSLIAAGLAAMLAGAAPAHAAPQVTRLTPPSNLFRHGRPEPIVARFLPGQRFDLQATVVPDAGQSLVAAAFKVDGRSVQGAVTLSTATALAGAQVVTLRAHSEWREGVHQLEVTAQQSDGQLASAVGNFEVVSLKRGAGRDAKNVIVMIGDGMGIAHRTAARLVLQGASQGKADGLLAMDQFPHTGIVITHSLNSIVTDSSPGAACYATGNKSNNNQT
jgi:alkaline phosphatase